MNISNHEIPSTVTTLLAAALLISCASTSNVGNVSFEFPRTWHISTEGDGLTASPDPNLGLPLLNVQACERMDPACATPCEQRKIRDAYFIFSASGGHVEYTQTSHPDGSIDFGATGVIPGETGDVQAKARVLCSSKGIVFVNLMSRTPIEELSPEFERTIQSVRWRQ